MTHLNEVCKTADVSHETRNIFLQKLLAEHSGKGSREQLKDVWTKWVATNYQAISEESEGGGKLGMDAATPDESEEEDDAAASGSAL